MDDEVEIIHADTSAYVALADASADWRYGNAECLSGLDFSDYDFLSVSKDGFVPVVVKPTYDNRFNGMMYQ